MLSPTEALRFPSSWNGKPPLQNPVIQVRSSLFPSSLVLCQQGVDHILYTCLLVLFLMWKLLMRRVSCQEVCVSVCVWCVCSFCSHASAAGVGVWRGMLEYLVSLQCIAPKQSTLHVTTAAATSSCNWSVNCVRNTWSKPCIVLICPAVTFSHHYVGCRD